MGRKLRRGLGALAVGGLATLFSLAPRTGYSAVDSDHDGLSDDLETSLTLNPNNASSDDDAFSDGVEYYNLNCDPTNPNMPDINHQFTQLDSVEDVTSTGLSHRFPNGISSEGIVSFVKMNPDYTSPTLNVLNPITGEERELCGWTGFGFRSNNKATFSPDGDYIILGEREVGVSTPIDLWAVNVNTGVKHKLTNLTGTQTLRNPSISGNNVYASARNMFGENVAIFAFPFSADSIDTSTGTLIIKTPSLSIYGDPIEADVSEDGNKALVRSLTNSTPQRDAFRNCDIEGILTGEQPPITLGESRSKSLFSETMRHFILGFSQDARAAVISRDVSGNFDPSAPSTFVTSDFDLHYLTFNSDGSLASNTRLPLLGNQVLGVYVTNGERAYFSTDNDFTTSTSANIASSSFTQNNRALPWGYSSGMVDSADFTVKDGRGLALRVEQGTTLSYLGTPSDITFSITGLSLGGEKIVDAQITAPVYVGPQGLEFNSGGGILAGNEQVSRRKSSSNTNWAYAESPIATLTFTYTERQLGGKDPADLAPVMYVNSGGEPVEIPLEVMGRNEADREIVARLDNIPSDTGGASSSYLGVRGAREVSNLRIYNAAKAAQSSDRVLMGLVPREQSASAQYWEIFE